MTWQRLGEQIAQTPAAPEPILIDRLESQGIQNLFTHWSPLLSPGIRHGRMLMAEAEQHPEIL